MTRAKAIRAVTAIDVVEAAYSLDGSEAAWLTALLEKLHGDLDSGSGVYGFTGDSTVPELDRSPAFAQRQLSPEFMARVATLNAEAPDAIFDLLKTRLVTCGGLAQVLGAENPIVTHFRGLMESAGIVDGFCMFAQDTRGGSITISAPSGAVVAPSPRVRGIWHRVGLHVVGALRLRRRLAASASQRDALLSPSGKIEDAGNAIADDNVSRRALTDAVRSMEEARRASVRAEPEHALDLWRGLVAGRWSLVEHWEQSGTRYIAAYANRPGLNDPRALTATEQSVLHYLVLGATNKEASYALGLPEKTVSACVTKILKKLGMRSRVDVAAVFDASRSTRFDIDDQLSVMAVDRSVDAALADRLTKAEREIAGYVAQGWSNARIAKARSSSAATVAKQLQAIYDKLGVDNRTRLAKLVSASG